jgi:hypothetical protein
MNNQPVVIEKPCMLDSIGGIPFLWFREIDAACDRFFAKRGIVYEGFSWKQDIHAKISASR